MLSNFVGMVDWSAASVLMTLFISAAGVAVALIARFKTRSDMVKIDNERHLAEQRQADENRRAQYALETEQMKQLDQGLITSHERKRD